MTDYDLVRYPCHAYPLTHPAHLFVLGRFHGMDPADPAACRVLEIGCGDGGNLLPMAWQYPQSRFIGFDLARTSIADGQRHVQELGLENLDLRHLDLMDFPEDAGLFDYIIAHGFYSWVPEPVRERMLRLVKRVLSPRGIAFVSYNAYPGGHLRSMVREMVLFHVANAPDARTKVEQGKAFLGLLEAGMADADEHGRLLKAEVTRVRQFDPAHYFHDDLAAINQSFYIHEFASQAGAHGLQYLTDADFASTQDNRMAPEIRELLAQLSGNPVLREQYMDFLKCRRFRQTLLCHDGVTLHRNPGPAGLREFFVGGAIAAEPDKTDEWRSPQGARLRSGHPVAKAALSSIGAHWPGRYDFASLTDVVMSQTGGPREAVAEVLEKVLWEAYTVGMIDAWPEDASFAVKPSEKPVASALARHLLKHGNSVVTLLHTTVAIGDAVGRHLISLLDGTRDVESLVHEMAGSAPFLEVSSDPALARENVITGLAQLARLGLLAK